MLSVTSPPRAAQHHVLSCLLDRKRKATSQDPNDTPEPESSGRKTPTSEVCVGLADTKTPFRTGSAHRAKESATNSRSGSRSLSATVPTNNPPAAASKSTQPQMDQYLMDEMRGAIFCDPHFVENFLAAEPAYAPALDQVVEQCPINFDDTLQRSISGELGLYPAVLSVLNTIKHIVDGVRESQELGKLGSDIIDHHASSFPGDDPDLDRIKPDLVMFEDETEHWETLMMPIEVKTKATHLKTGLKQLTRYARTVFAHQIHRRFVYGMVICRWAATFVRFDRSGILHSKPIDMRGSPKEFQRAFGGLMMLDRNRFGYDTAFTVERTRGRRAEYFVDLPADAAPSSDGGSERTPSGSTSPSGDGAHEPISHQPPNTRLPDRKFKVMERLCHRKCIRGRATIVLRLREVRRRREECEDGEAGPGPRTRQRAKQTEKEKSEESEWEEIPGGPTYVLKLMWRDPHKRPEGEVVKGLENAYGVVEYLWHSDVLKGGASCHEPGARSCEKCCDATPASAVDQVTNLEDLDIEVPDEKEGEEPQYVEVQTDRYIGKAFPRRTARIYTWMLVASVGRLLWTAHDAREMLEAIRDAILGYWHVVNRGILHRDISDGNVLIREPQIELDTGAQREGTEQDEPPATPTNDLLTKSKQRLREMLEPLPRVSSGFLSDYDLFATHGGMELEFFGEVAKRKGGEPDSQTSAAEDVVETEPDPKRRKQSKDSTPSSYGTERRQEQGQSEEANLLLGVTPASKAYAPTDFRTGTPTFMSNRILALPLGETYQHHFMDDLQSFFWLIFWCAVQHIDSGPNGRPTQAAVKLLSQLDPADGDLDTLGKVKRSILADCFQCDIQEALKACKNSWANDPMVVGVVQRLGTYFFNVGKRFSRCTPETEFPKVINIISEALGAHPNVEATSTSV